MEIGDYQIPDLDIGTAKAITQTIRDRFDGTVTYDDETEVELAKALGHQTHESGAFRAKLTDLDNYSLLAGRSDRSLTPLADTLLENERDAMLTIIEEFELFQEAHQEFGRRLPAVDDWENFLRERGIATDSQKTKKSWKRYISISRNLPSDVTHAHVETLGKERDFEFYLKKLGNPKTQDAALKALLKNLKRMKLPDMDPVNKVMDQITEDDQEGEVTGQDEANQENLYRILKAICENNELDEATRNQVLDMLYNTLSEVSKAENIDKEASQNIASYVRDTWEAISPETPPRQVLDLGFERLEQSVDEGNELMRDFAKMQLIRWSMTKPFRDRFFQEFADEIEKEVWELIEDSDNETLRKDYGDVLRYLGVT